MYKLLPRDLVMLLVGGAGGLGLALFMNNGIAGQDSASLAGKGEDTVRAVRKSILGDPGSAADSNPQVSIGDLRRMLDAPEGLERRMEFLKWLGGVNTVNWKESWGNFAEATKGRSGANVEELNQILTRIGEVAGREGMEFFAAMEASYGISPKSGVVMTAWASKSPADAWEYYENLPSGTQLTSMFAESVESALILGTGRHSVESLKDLAERFHVERIFQKGREMMASARQRGQVADGEAIWRRYQERRAEAYPEAEKDVGTQIFSEFMTWKGEAAKAEGTGTALFPWLEGLMDEGFTVGEDALSQVTHAAAEAAPMDTLQWASDIAVKLSEDPDQQQRVTRQQGFEAAQNWAKTDAEGLSRWLTVNPDHLAYDTGAAALYKILKDADPTASAAWGAEIKDISLRRWVKLEP